MVPKVTSVVPYRFSSVVIKDSSRVRKPIGGLIVQWLHHPCAETSWFDYVRMWIDFETTTGSRDRNIYKCELWEEFYLQLIDVLGSTLKNITLWVTALLQCRISYVSFCGFCQTYLLNLACHAKHKLRLPIHSTSAQNSAFGFVKWMVRSLSRSPCLDDSVSDDSRN